MMYGAVGANTNSSYVKNVQVNYKNHPNFRVKRWRNNSHVSFV